MSFNVQRSMVVITFLKSVFLGFVLFCSVFYFALNHDVEGHYLTAKAIVYQQMKIHGRERKQLIMKSSCIQYVLGGWRLWFY